MLLKSLKGNALGRFLTYLRNKTDNKTSWEKQVSSNGTVRQKVDIPLHGVELTVEICDSGGLVNISQVSRFTSKEGAYKVDQLVWDYEQTTKKNKEVCS